MTQETAQRSSADNLAAGRASGSFDRGQLVAVFFFGVLLFLFYQLYRVFSPFLAAIAWGAILVMIFYPLYEWLVRKFAGRVALASGGATLLVILMVIVPGFISIEALASQLLDIYRSVSSNSGQSGLESLASKLKATPFGGIWATTKEVAASYAIDLESIVLAGAKSMSVFLAEEVRLAVKNVFLSALSFLMMVISLFFFFRDGEKLYRIIHSLIPMEESHKDVVFLKFYETISAVVRGLIVTAAVQGVLAGLAYWVLGVPYPAFMGFLTALLAVIPFLGAASVWLPVSLYLLLTGATLNGLILTAWGFLVVSTVDNVLKPVLIGNRTNINSLFLLFSILGGLQAYGFLGLFLGPVLLAILIAFLDIYREVYQKPVI